MTSAYHIISQPIKLIGIKFVLIAVDTTSVMTNVFTENYYMF
jgi:hypothetical protein